MNQVVRDFQAVINLPFGTVGISKRPFVVPGHPVVVAQGVGGFVGVRSGEKLKIKRWPLRHEGWL